ncbi:MAG: 30S ribosomal protein S17 [Phycisphaerae bacterium]|nr:30S ribosomal protein S17 [Phycisphaerae bacterium]
MDTTESGKAVVTPPAAPRTRRATRIGVVASAARQKTIKVTVSYLVKHGKYGKFLSRRTVMHAHDENNEAGAGDLVEVAECRPISKTKNWRLVRIVQRAPRQAAEVLGQGGEA